MRLAKSDIINKLFIEHDIWEAGFRRVDLKAMTVKELVKWLQKLEESNNSNRKRR